MYKLHVKCLWLFIMGILLTACTQDSYEKEEGWPSPSKTYDFAEVHVNAAKLIDYVITDNGDMLKSTLAPCKWAQTTDTLYRAIIGYYRTGSIVDVNSCSRVTTVGITPLSKVKIGMKTDPVKMESVWLSNNRRFLNAGIYLKIGSTAIKDIVHHLGVVSDTLMTHTDGKSTLMLRLYHDQGGMPEYYSERIWFSIPLQDVRADSICLSINTYTGIVAKTFAMK